MRISIDKTGSYTVSISGDFTGPYINLDVSPAVAYDLLLSLDKVRDELRDLAQNYYDCSECGETHHKSIKSCPNIGGL
jgi:hypothetical protein